MNRSGTSLIELLLYLALAASLLFGVTSIIFLAQVSGVRNRAVNSTELVANHILTQIEQAVEKSTSITTPAAGSSGSQLVLGMPSTGSNPTTFDLSGSNLRITEGSGSAIRLNPDHVTVSSFSVSNVTGSGAAGTVKVTLTLQTGAGSARSEFIYQKTFYLTAVSRQE